MSLYEEVDAVLNGWIYRVNHPVRLGIAMALYTMDVGRELPAVKRTYDLGSEVDMIEVSLIRIVGRKKVPESRDEVQSEHNDG